MVLTTKQAINEAWFPFRAAPYGNAVVDGRPREDWDWTVISANDPDEGATSFDCEGEAQAEWLAGVLNAAHLMFDYKCRCAEETDCGDRCHQVFAAAQGYLSLKDALRSTRKQSGE